MGELAPELLPMLASVQMPANFVPLTNAVLAEMARRSALVLFNMDNTASACGAGPANSDDSII